MAIFLGLIIGAAIGTTGVGGGVLTAPALILILGLHSAESVGTALIFSTLIKLNTVIAYLHRKRVDFPTLGYLILGGVPGAVLGAWFMERKQSAANNPAILAIVGGTIVVTACFSLVRTWLAPRAKVRLLKGLALASFPIGAEVGFSSAGAGALGTVLLLSVTPLAPAVAVGTDLCFGMAVSAVGAAVHMAAGSWNGVVLLQLLAGGLLGSAAGARLADILPRGVLRAAVLVWALLLGLLLLHKALTTAAP